MSNDVVLWKAKSPLAIKGSDPSEIVTYSDRISKREQNQIVNGFNSQSYEMVSAFVLTKALNALRGQLASLGMDFVGEMLSRQDLDEDSSPDEIPAHAAFSLAQDLGILTKTKSLRLKQSYETVMHFSSSQGSHFDTYDDDEEGMREEEAMLCLKVAVESVLGRDNDIIPIGFVEFRDSLLTKTLKPDDSQLENLINASYFYKKTALSILLSKIKLLSGSELEHVLGNFGVILPLLWKKLRQPEKWQVGETYRDVYSEGKSIATVALKKVLVRVRGFDFVPESLRSSSYSQAASKVLSAHDGMDNFYNEPRPMKALASMGSTIPYPAFSQCLTATIAVELGNSFGRSFDAVVYSKKILDRLSEAQWIYYFNECLPSDNRILEKLSTSNLPRKNWLNLAKRYEWDKLDVDKRHTKRLLLASVNGEKEVVRKVAGKMLVTL